MNLDAIYLPLAASCRTTAPAAAQHARPPLLYCISMAAVLLSLAVVNFASQPDCTTATVRNLAPEGAILPTAEWGLGAATGDYVYVAGMRGIDQATNTLVPITGFANDTFAVEARVRKAYENMLLIAADAGAGVADCVRLVVFVTDMFPHRAAANRVTRALWGDGPYCPRTIVEVDALNQEDIFEVQGTFYTGSSGVIPLAPEGAILPTAEWGLGSSAGEYVFVAGMRGIDQETNTLIPIEGPTNDTFAVEARVRKAYENMQFIASAAGVDVVTDCVRTVVYVTDMFPHRAAANRVIREIWGDGPYCPRTIVEISALNQEDIFEVEGTFHKGPVTPLAPEGAVLPTAEWGLGSSAGDYVFVAGMRGIDQETNTLIPIEGSTNDTFAVEARVRKAYENMQFIASAAGVDVVTDCVRTVVYVTDMFPHRAAANRVIREIWGDGPYCPRTIVEISALNQEDLFEVEGTFYKPAVSCA